MLTSASRTGSQKPMASPGRSPQRQSGRSGLSGSGRFEGQIFSPPTEIGNRHDQQISVIGLTKLPVQRPGPASALAGLASASPRPASRLAARRRSDFMGGLLVRSEEHTSELQSLMRISYAVFCLKKKMKTHHKQTVQPHSHLI